MEKPQSLNEQYDAAVLLLLHPAYPKIALFTVPEHSLFLSEKNKYQSFRFFKYTPAALLSRVAPTY